MMHPGFFEREGPFSVDVIAKAIGAKLTEGADKSREIDDIRPLDSAGPGHLSFLDNTKYLNALGRTNAGACIVASGFADRVPSSTVIMIAPVPYRSFAKAMGLFYADATLSKGAGNAAGSAGPFVHDTAKIGKGCTIEPGAVIGQEAVIGDGTRVSAGTVIGYRVVLGADCYLGANCTVTHAIIGDRVILHPGARIGQDGFGFAMGKQGHEKIPQIGCVRIGSDVEIGANTTVDRGSLADTVIGEGTKIDNLVQIAHNVVIGRHCIIVAQSGIAGSSKLGDHVVMGAKSGVLGHVKVGNGAQIAGMAHVKDDVPAGARMGGTPARPFAEWAREVAALRLLGRKRLT